jgi:hypothetical protein
VGGAEAPDIDTFEKQRQLSMLAAAMAAASSPQLHAAGLTPLRGPRSAPAGSPAGPLVYSMTSSSMARAGSSTTGSRPPRRIELPS